MKAFSVFVRPLLEYGSCLWNRHLVKDVNLIERVQRKFNRQLFVRARLPMISYAERCAYLNIDLLKLRRMLIYLLCIIQYNSRTQDHAIIYKSRFFSGKFY